MMRPPIGSSSPIATARGGSVRVTHLSPIQHLAIARGCSARKASCKTWRVNAVCSGLGLAQRAGRDTYTRRPCHAGQRRRRALRSVQSGQPENLRDRLQRQLDHHHRREHAANPRPLGQFVAAFTSISHRTSPSTPAPAKCMSPITRTGGPSAGSPSSAAAPIRS